MDCPFIHRVPRDTIAENLAYRLDVYREAATDRGLQRDLRFMCSQDVLFWVNTFCWTFNPRDYPDDPHRPFMTWGYQDQAILAICEAIEKRLDVVCFKSRQMGATWVCQLPLKWRWQFRDGQSFLMASRVEDDVDKPGRPKSLFWKLDYLDQWMPTWLLPSAYDLGDGNPNRTKMHAENPDNGSVIEGTATVPDLGRGDVLTAILLDEAASMENATQIAKATRNATHTRIWNSTPKGKAGKGEEFWRQSQNPNHVRIRLHWSQHPEKNRGLYRFVDGRMVAVDPVNNPLPADYEVTSLDLIADLRRRGFQLEGKDRSPYYDQQCGRSSSELEIRQEEDIDFLAEGATFFEPGVLEDCLTRCIPPLREGTLDVDSETIEPEWLDTKHGPWKLWTHLNERSCPPTNTDYLIGVDIAAGLGGVHSSNSSIEVIDAYTGLQVAEFASKTVKPDALAKLAVAACKWFCGMAGLGAMLNWEENGSAGSEFTKQIEKLRWPRLYLRTTGKEFSAKTSKVPGWRSNEVTKPKMLGQLRTALREGTTVPRSTALVNECGEYVIENGDIVHAESTSTTDESAKKGLHGDRVIAYGLAVLMREEHPRRFLKDKKPPAQPGSILYRREQRRIKSVRVAKW